MTAATPITAREVHLVARPHGAPKASDFAVVDAPIARPGPDQVLVRNEWLSVDPYMRGRMNDVKSYVPPLALGAPMDGAAVGTVVESNTGAIPVGSRVMHGLGWREYATVEARLARVVDTAAAPAEAYLGVLGTTGLAAYVGLKTIAPVRHGDVVFISAAAGAVGIVACRVARALGATTVIGSAGGPEKARRLVKDFGYDHGIDYRQGALRDQVCAAAPDGIDVYFDNVGGDHLRAALALMREHGRVALCGAISRYNAIEAPPRPDLLVAIARRISLRGFIVSDHFDLFDEYTAQATDWLRDGSLPSEMTVVDGIEHAYEAFVGLLRGANTGKMLVRLSG